MSPNRSRRWTYRVAAEFGHKDITDDVTEIGREKSWALWWARDSQAEAWARHFAALKGSNDRAL